MQIKDLQDERYLLISNSQDRREVLEHLGLEDELWEWPHLLVWAEDGEYREVWGCRFTPPLLADPAVRLHPKPTGYDPPEPDEAVE